jgi:hypothetical protein
VRNAHGSFLPPPRFPLVQFVLWARRQRDEPPSADAPAVRRWPPDPHSRTGQEEFKERLKAGGVPAHGLQHEGGGISKAALDACQERPDVYYYAGRAPEFLDFLRALEGKSCGAGDGEGHRGRRRHQGGRRPRPNTAYRSGGLPSKGDILYELARTSRGSAWNGSRGVVNFAGTERHDPVNKSIAIMRMGESGPTVPMVRCGQLNIEEKPSADPLCANLPDAPTG